MGNNNKKPIRRLFNQATIHEYIQNSMRFIESFYEDANRWSRGWLAVFVRAWNRYNQNHGHESAAGVTFYVILSIIPLIVFVISAVSPFLTRPLVLHNVANYLSNALPISLEGLMDVIDSVLASHETPNLIATIGLLWAASNMFNFILVSINRAWNTKRSRGFVKNRLLAVVFVTALAVFVVVLMIMLLVVRVVANLLPEFGNILLVIMLPLFIQSSLIFLVYKFGPEEEVDTESALISALLATLSMEILTRGFTWYINSEWSTYAILYGSLGTLISLLFWLFLTFWILLYGAYVSEAICKRKMSSTPRTFFEPLTMT